MVEGAPLETGCALTRTVGSNPTPTAILQIKFFVLSFVWFLILKTLYDKEVFLMDISVKEERKDVFVIDFNSWYELDFQNTVYLIEKLRNLMKKGCFKMVLDMEKIFFISVYTVGIFVALARDLREIGGDIVFINLNDGVRETFSVTRIDSILYIFNNREEAVELFSENLEREVE